ncbi:MAG: lysine--tRNA ligase, partial [Lachnospiraceae bacterium]|nr:lysine--tRNA ligase [Lachnospiraceae bacterium]
MAETTKIQDENQLIKVRREKLAALQAAGQDPFVITKFDQTEHSADITDDFEAYEGREVSIAGRMLFKRVMGKASFCNIKDLKGSIQCYVTRDDIGDDHYADFNKFDIGDIIGIKGVVFKTKTGEISVHA